MYRFSRIGWNFSTSVKIRFKRVRGKHLWKKTQKKISNFQHCTCSPAEDFSSFFYMFFMRCFFFTEKTISSCIVQLFRTPKDLIRKNLWNPFRGDPKILKISKDLWSISKLYLFKWQQSSNNIQPWCYTNSGDISVWLKVNLRINIRVIKFVLIFLLTVKFDWSLNAYLI